MNLQRLLEEVKLTYHTIPESHSVEQAVQLLSAHGVSALIVEKDGTGHSLFTEKDLVRSHLLFPGQAASEIFLKDVVTPTRYAAQSEEMVEAAIGMMVKSGTRHLAVMLKEEIIGVLGLEDLIKAHVRTLNHEINYLQDYISDLQDAKHD